MKCKKCGSKARLRHFHEDLYAYWCDKCNNEAFCDLPAKIDNKFCKALASAMDARPMFVMLMMAITAHYTQDYPQVIIDLDLLATTVCATTEEVEQIVRNPPFLPVATVPIKTGRSSKKTKLSRTTCPLWVCRGVASTEYEEGTKPRAFAVIELFDLSPDLGLGAKYNPTFRFSHDILEDRPLVKCYVEEIVRSGGESLSFFHENKEVWDWASETLFYSGGSVYSGVGEK